MDRLKQTVNYILARKFQTFVVAAILLFVSMYLLPAPYNARYLFNRAFRNPTGICEDRIYTFAATHSGACSGHGGVDRWIRREK